MLIGESTKVVDSGIVGPIQNDFCSGIESVGVGNAIFAGIGRSP